MKLKLNTLLGLPIILSALTSVLLLHPLNTQAATRSVPVNLQKYCKSQRLDFAGFNKKKKRFVCGIYTTGFNTGYFRKLRAINLTQVCRAAHKTDKWRYKGDKVWCLVEDGANLRLCNRRSEPVWSVVGHYVKPGSASTSGWVTKGWWKINANKCRNLWTNRTYSGDVYIHGRTRSNSLHGQATRMCVNGDGAFTLGNADTRRCKKTGQKRVGMYQFNLKSGNNTWTFN